MLRLQKIKQHARKMLKRNYTILVIACLVAALLGSKYSFSIYLNSVSRTIDNVSDVIEVKNNLVGIPNISDVLKRVFNISLENSVSVNEQGEITNIGILELGRRNGVFSFIVNSISGQKIIAVIVEAVTTIIKSKSIGFDFLIILAAIILLSFLMFFQNVYKISFLRIYLESYRYDTTKASRFLFLYRAKKVFKVAWTVFVVSLFKLLWNLTIIGAIFVRYNYMMVPYIIAENPDINYSDAIKLSRRMVYGYRFKLFICELSFLPLYIIGRLTFGLTDVILTNPYLECCLVQYYFELRKYAKDNKVSYADYLNDKYLAVKPTYKQVEKAYGDVVEAMTNDIEVRDLRNDGWRGFIENNLGIIYHYDEKEDAYNEAIEEEEKIADYRRIMDLRQYPARLSPIENDNGNKRVEYVHYLRHYSIYSLIIIFFIFSFIGWAWEFLLYLIEDGMFVNRGFLYGPWLPIYGTGGIAILIFLFRYRNKPFLQALLAVTICGFVEYYTSYILELTKGMKWWDYSGYFINVDGRICAEGLLIFMLGGIGAVYMIAPMIDNKLRKINKKLLCLICIVLLLLFSVDITYSIKKPNTGKGITEYDDTSYHYQKEVDKW